MELRNNLAKKKYNKIFFILLMSKKRFLIFGLFNVLITNIILQALLFYLKISLATLISQIVGMLLGFLFMVNLFLEIHHFQFLN